MPSSPTSAASAPSHPFRTVFPVLALCWPAVFFDGMDVNIYGAVMPHMLDDTGLGLTQASADTIGSWTTFGMLVGALTAGNLTDWSGRQLTLVSSVTLFSIGSAICATEGGVGLFGCGRFIAGLGLGGLMPLWPDHGHGVRTPAQSRPHHGPAHDLIPRWRHGGDGAPKVREVGGDRAGWPSPYEPARQPARRLILRICLSKARAGTRRRTVLTRPAVGPAV
jgi:hypothetical protein